MASITIDRIRKSYGSLDVLKDFSLEIADANSSCWSALRVAANRRC